MDNVGEPVGELETISEETVIEKPKKIQKMRETHSAAQLETLRIGREKLAAKRAKQKEEKQQAPVQDLLLKFEQRCNEVLNNLEQRVQEVKIAPKNNSEEFEVPPPPKIQKFFV